MLLHSLYKSNCRNEYIFIHEYIVRNSILMCFQKMEFWNDIIVEKVCKRLATSFTKAFKPKAKDTFQMLNCIVCKMTKWYRISSNNF